MLKRWILPVAGLAITYAVVGRLSLLLAIPPGYASPVWPAAGIGLAWVLIFGTRVWPGIVLGSFLVNLWTGLDASSSAALVKSILLPVGIGSGAAVQAVVGAWFIRRFVSWPHPLNTGASVTKFLLLAGPASCVINATVGPECLLIAGFIGPAQYIVTWGTWWVGDAIGVLVFAPLTLLWTSSAFQFQHRRQMLVTMPLVAAFMLAVVFFIWVRALEYDRFRLEFSTQADTLASTLERAVTIDIESIYAINAFYAGSEAVTREQFRAFVQSILARHSGIQGLGWNVRVTDGERQAYEAQVKQEGLGAFHVQQLDESGVLVPARHKPEYIVVHYLEPYKGNENVFGFDVTSELLRLAALNQARDTGELVATALITLVQESGDKYGFLIFEPVYQKGFPHLTVEERRKHLKGFIVGVFRVSDLIQVSLRDFGQKNLQLMILDATIPTDKQPMVIFHMDRGTVDIAKQIQTVQEKPNALAQVRQVIVGNRCWELHFIPKQTYLSTYRTWEVWAVLIGGLLFTGLLGAMLFIGTGQTQLIEARVKQAEEALKTTQLQLIQVAKLESVGRLAAGVAHEVKNPLAIILQGTAYLKASLPPEDGTMASVVESIQQAVLRADQVIRGLLDFSAPNKLELSFQDLNSLIERALLLINHELLRNRVTLDKQLGEGLPKTQCDANKIEQVFINLLMNAIQAMPHGGTLTVKTSYRQLTQPGSNIGRRATDCFHIGETALIAEVEDTGVGIPAEQLSKIFDPFFTTKATGQGTGLGLAVIQKILELHQATVEIANRAEGGVRSTVMFKGTLS